MVVEVGIAEKNASTAPPYSNRKSNFSKQPKRAANGGARSLEIGPGGHDLEFRLGFV